jgi:hypothetical protein
MRRFFMKEERSMTWDIVGPILAVAGLLAFSIFVLPRIRGVG